MDRAFDIGARQAPWWAISICTHVLCHTVSVNSHEIHAPSLGSGASVGGAEVEVASRRSGSGSDYDQWTLSVKSEIHTPSPTKHRPTKRPPNLTNLGRASDETVVLHMAKYRSRTLRVTAKRLSNVQGQTRRFRPQCANRSFVRLVSVIT